MRRGYFSAGTSSTPKPLPRSQLRSCGAASSTSISPSKYRCRITNSLGSGSDMAHSLVVWDCLARRLGFRRWRLTASYRAHSSSRARGKKRKCLRRETNPPEHPASAARRRTHARSPAGRSSGGGRTGEQPCRVRPGPRCSQDCHIELLTHLLISLLLARILEVQVVPGTHASEHPGF